MAKPIELLRDALTSTGVVLPLKVTSKGNSHSILCRPIRGQDMAWVDTVEKILVAFEDKEDIQLHLGRQYVLKGGKMAAGWYVGITCPRTLLETAVGSIVEILTDVERVEEIENETPGRQFKSRYPEANQQLQQQLTGMRGRTTADPRSPDRIERLTDSHVPNRDVTLHTTLDRIKTTATGSMVREIHQEIPLAHQYVEMNRPNAKGGGVLGGADSTPMILQRTR